MRQAQTVERDRSLGSKGADVEYLLAVRRIPAVEDRYGTVGTGVVVRPTAGERDALRDRDRRSYVDRARLELDRVARIGVRDRVREVGVVVDWRR